MSCTRLFVAYAFWERRNEASRLGTLERVWREFAEMPGLRLTCEQASRLSSLERNVCGRVLATLEQQGLLSRDAGGMYYRSDIGPGVSTSDDA